VFTELVLDRCGPSAVIAVDPAATQIAHACRQPVAKRAAFQVADAQELPFPDESFDMVVSALALNFIPDPARALGEMRRVARGEGVVAAYVWDFAGGRGPFHVLRTGLRQMGIEPPVVPGTMATTRQALHSLFDGAGFEDIASRTIEVALAFSSFDELWLSQTPVFNPITKIVASLPESDRGRLMEFVRSALPADADGRVTCSARAHAIKARVPSCR
jgi:SAM-dependent methyltransferase